MTSIAAMQKTVAVHTIGEASRRTGCKVETIRYYEQAGLMPDPPRSEGRHRLYSEEQMRRLMFIRRGRELGFSLNEIRDLLGLVDGGYTCGEVRNLTVAHLDDVRGKLKDLRRLQKTLQTIASQCDGGAVPECPIIDALYEGPKDHKSDVD